MSILDKFKCVICLVHSISHAKNLITQYLPTLKGKKNYDIYGLNLIERIFSM